ncbi:MAG: PAS domain S-box protein [Bacteroidota bacterium]
MKDNEKTNRSLLRLQADELLKLNDGGANHVSEAETDMLKLIHELQVHQIELELQKEELTLANQQVELAKEKYSGLFNFAPLAYFTVTASGIIMEINLMGAKMLGKDRRSLLNCRLADFILSDSRNTFDDFLLKISAGLSLLNCEVPFNTVDGVPLHAHLGGTLADDGIHCLITAVDITARQQAEFALQQSETKYRQLAENSTSIVYRILLKPKLKFDYVSPSVTTITGYTPEDHYNDAQLGFKLVHPDDRILLENTKKHSNGEPLELRWIRKDGRVIWTEQRNVLLFDKNNEPFAIEGNARDITDRKNIELGLRKEAELNSLLLGLFVDAPALTDKELYDQALDIAVKITDSKIGFFHQVSDNQQEIILTTWNDEAKKNCTAVHNNHYPIEIAGNWADCIRQKRAVVNNDYTTSPNKKGLPEGHALVERTMSIPVVHEEKALLVFGVGNKSIDYTDLDVIQIQSVANELHKILEKRKVEKDLQESRERWHFAIEGSNDGIWDWNMLTDDIFFSNRWKEMIGYGTDELQGKLSEWKTRVHPDDIEAVMFDLQQHFSQETKDYTNEHRLLCKDGSWKWILDRGKVLKRTKDGKPTRMVGTHTDITERKNTEVTISKSEEKFRIVADNAFNWEFWEGADGKWIHHSPSCKKLTGYSANDFLNDDDLLQKIIHPGDRKAYIDHHHDTMSNQIHGRHSFRIITREGETRYIDHVCQAVFDDDNKYIGIRGSNVDVTERIQAENQLQESLVQFRNLANAGSALIWTSGTDKLCNYFNETWLKFTGRTLEQEMGNGWANGVHPDDFDRCLETYLSAFDKQLPFEMEYRLQHSDGEYRWILDLGTPNFNSTGEFVGYIGHCFDISERKITELALNESEERYRSIFESVQEVYFEASMDGTLLEVSPSVEKISRGHFFRDEMIGQSFSWIYANPGERDIYFSKLLEQKRVNDYELHLQNKDGSIIPVAVSSVLSFDADGKPAKITGILRDITDRKFAEKALNETLEQLNEANLLLEKRVEERTKEILEISGLQKAILTNAPLAILTTDKDGLFQSINPAGEKMLGYTADEVVGKLESLFFHDKEETKKFCIKNTAISNPTEDEISYAVLQYIFQKTTEWTWTRKNGEKFPVSITHNSIVDDNGRLHGYMALVIDISQEKFAMESLYKSEAENRAIIQAVPDLMFRIDRNGTYLDSHSQNESALYVPKALFVGKKVSEILPPDLARQSMQVIEKAFITGEVVQFEYMLTIDDKDRYFENRTTSISEKEVLSIIRDITHRKESETALRMQSAAFESFALTIIITDIAGRIQWVNSAFTQLTGYSVDEAIGKMPGELIISGKQDKNFYEKFWDTILNKKVWSGELINQRKDGSLYYEEETITPVLDAQGNISSFIAIKIDITERKKLYQELADEKRRLADIIKGTNAGTWEWNIKTGETIFNEQWAGMLGYTLDEISPVSIETWMKFSHPDDLKTSGELLEKHFKGELDYYSFESRMKHKNGGWIWVLDRGRVHERDSEGMPLFMSGTHQDITGHKKAEDDLKESTERHRGLSEAAFDSIFFSEKGVCVEQNQMAEKIFGYTNEEAIGRFDTDWIVESDRKMVMENMLAGYEEPYEVTALRKDRTTFPCMLSGRMMYYKGRNVRVTSLSDITRRKQAETALIEAKIEAEKANLAKSEFLSRMSHELRTPMNSILGFAQLMEMGQLNPKQKKGVTHILNNGKHLLSLINEVLDISGIEAGRQILTPEPVQLAAIINDITGSIQVAADKRKISIELVDSPANNLFIWADRLRLTQILLNLINNAIKYNNEGGSVTIKTSLKPSNDAGIAKVRISICDTGNGIKPEDIGKLFQAFERIGADRTETEGTGLGLMVVNKITEAMGGTVGVVSEVGTGSTFWIELPLTENLNPYTGKTTVELAPELQVSKQAGTILYIEDNLSNVELAEEIMIEYRPAIHLVTSIYGKETVKLAKKHKPDLILLDLDLPDLQGIEVLEQLLSDPQTKTIPVIIISADAMPFQVKKLMKAGASDYLTKPLDVVQFLITIDRHSKI